MMTLTLALLGLPSPFPTRVQGRGSPLHLAGIETFHSLSGSHPLADWDSIWYEWKRPLLPASCAFLATFMNFALPGSPVRDSPQI